MLCSVNTIHPERNTTTMELQIHTNVPAAVARVLPPWERAAADPSHTDAEALYLMLAYTTGLLDLPRHEQAYRLAWTPRKVYRVRAGLLGKGWEV